MIQVFILFKISGFSRLPNFFLRIYNQLSFFISFIKVLKIYIDEHPIFMNVDILSYVYISSNRWLLRNIFLKRVKDSISCFLFMISDKIVYIFGVIVLSLFFILFQHNPHKYFYFFELLAGVCSRNPPKSKTSGWVHG